MNYWRDYTDLYRSGELDQIQFQNSIKQNLKKWGSSMGADDFLKKNDNVCYKQVKHARYLGAQFQQLFDDINNTRNLFQMQLELRKDQMNFVPEKFLKLNRVQEAISCFLLYKNQRLNEIVYSSQQSKVKFELAWLMEKIFIETPTTQQAVDETLNLITTLECLKLDERLVYTPDKKMIQDYFWHVHYSETFVKKVSAIDSDDLNALCFYLSLVYRGIVQSKIDNYTFTEKKLQMWRLTNDVRFSIEFADCLTDDAVNLDTVKCQYVTGRVLPIRLPVVKLNENDDETVTRELLSFQYTQFIHLDDIKEFQVKENLVTIEKTEEEIKQQQSSWAAQKKKREKQLAGIPEKPQKLKKYKKHLYKGWDVLSTPLQNLPFREILEIFLFTRMEEYLGFSQQSYDTLKERVSFDIFHNSKRIPTVRLYNTMMDRLKFITSDIHEYKFDILNRTWQPPAKFQPETVQVVSSYSNSGENFQKETFIVRQLAKESNTTKLLQILEQIPNLDLKLNYLQQAVVVSSQDLLCLGRSGTGKTTSSILRLFSQEIMYITLRKYADLKSKKLLDGESSKVVLTSQDLKQPCAMKTVFISASPVLVNEVSRFYKKLKESLIEYLEKKEKSGQVSQESTTSVSDFVQIQTQHEELIKLAQIEADEIDQEMAATQKFDMPNAFEDLRPRHFPLFATVKQLLYMLDASLSNSFFCRDNKNNLIGMSSNLSWHNENKGMFMINSEYKNVADYDDLLLKYGNELLQESDIPLPEIIDEKQQKKAEESLKVDNSWYQRYNTENTKDSKRSGWTYSNQQLSYEVDFDLFVSKFYKRFKSKQQKLQKQNKLSETMIWTEIFSVIKGGLHSSDHYQGFLTAKNYIGYHASPFLSMIERQTIYWIFLEYERWKKEENAFDLMDLVQHINSSGKASQSYYNEMRINYLMIDEVQDLTPKTLQLLLKITNERVFFAGDTAQTIAKGVGARFSDLSTLLSTFGTKVIQLTTNYRSHGQILALANSVVGLIETLFPFSIDKLDKEESLTTGMKPLVLMPLPDHQLRRILIGHQSNSTANATSSLTFNKPQFGCNQVIIVREQDQKDLLPEFLKGMLCLTVYEAKGLEFDDVILYNFFANAQIESMHWKLLNDVAIELSQQEEGVEFSQIVNGLESLLKDELDDELSEFKSHTRKQKNLLKQQRMINTSTKNSSLVYRKYALLCVELKMLYVAITRPKQRLIIYDDDAKCRLPIQRVWESLGVISVLNSTMLEQNMIPEELQTIVQSENGCLGSQKSKMDDWKIQGIKFYKKKQFDQAIKCFTYANEIQLVVKCTAYQLADSGNNKLAEADSNMWRVKSVWQLTPSERKALTKQALQFRSSARKDFEKAGQSFEKVDLKNQAASCFFTARNYKKAAEVFESLGQYSQAGECLMLAHSDGTAILRAAEMFERGNLTTRAIECYERIGAWEKLLQCLHQSKGAFKKTEREALANKYIPIALNKLYLLLTGEEKVEEKNQGALAEIKIKQKYAKQVQDQILEEDLEDQYDSEDESHDEEDVQIKHEIWAQQNLKIESKNEQSHSQVDSDNNEEIEIIDDDLGYEEAPLEVFEQVFQLKRHKSKQEENKDSEPIQEAVAQSDDQSYEIIDDDQDAQKSDDGSPKNKLNQYNSGHSDFEHLSQYDPDDEFLQSSSSYSLLESILQGRDFEHSSEYSIIDDDDSKSIISLGNSTANGSIRMIRSQKKVEDAIVRKIIFYISLFSIEVKHKLDRLGKSSKADDLEGISHEDQIELDQISADFLETILNILEHYDLIKLCLIICNKFKLTAKLGRYAVSSCLKYQSLQNLRFTHKFDTYKYDSIEHQKLKQQSMIAHEAIHNVFGLIAPQYLSLKRYDQVLNEMNSLGMDNYRLIFALGFWKKLVYTMNVSSSLQLCYKFNDIYNFNALLDKLSDQTDISQIHHLWTRSIYLKQASITLSKHINGSKSRDLDQIRKFQDIFASVREELSFTQLLEKPYVEDLVDLVSYLLIPDVKRTKQVPVVGNKIQAVDIQVQIANVKHQYQVLYDSTLKKAQDVIVKVFQNYAESPQQKMIQSYFAYQFAAYATSQQKLIRLVSDTSILIRLVDLFKKAQLSINSKTQCKLNKAQLLASYNIYTLESDNFFKEQESANFLKSHDSDDTSTHNESLFKQFEQSHYLVNINSQIIVQIARIQKLKLQTLLDCEYMTLGEQICTQEYRKQDRQAKILQLIKDLEKNSLPFDIQRFTSLPKTKQVSVAMIIDMDLQYLLVPKEWVETIIKPHINIVPAILNQIVENRTLNKIQQGLDSDSVMLANQTFILDCFNKNFGSLILSTLGDIQMLRKLDISKFYNDSIMKNQYNKLSYRCQKDLFSRLTQKLPNWEASQAKSVNGNMQSILDQRRIKANQMFELQNMMQSQKLKLPQVGSLANTFVLEQNQNLIMRQAGINFLIEAFSLENLPLSINSEQQNDFFYLYLKQSLHLFSISNGLVQFVDMISLLLKRKLLKSQDHILRGIRSQAFSNQCLLTGKINNSISHSLVFYKFVAPYISVQFGVEILEEVFYRSIVFTNNQTYVPDHTLNYLDSSIKVDELINNAILEEQGFKHDENYGAEQEYDQENSAEEIYDEWDRPEINEVKQIQLSKRPSRQPEKLHAILQYSVDFALSVDKINIVKKLTEVLENCLQQLVIVNQEEFSQIALKKIFNIVMCVCINTDVTPYVSLIRKCYAQFEKSSLSDQFQEILFQYTENPYDLKKMFQETDEYSKFLFFTDNLHLALVSVNSIVKEQQQPINTFDFDRALCARVISRITLRKCIRSQKGQNRNNLMKQFKSQFVEIGVDLKILKITQNIPVLPSYFSHIEQLNQRLQALQQYYTSSQTQVSCFDIQMILSRQNDFDGLLAKMINDLKHYFDTKCDILLEFEDMGAVDMELEQSLEQAKEKTNRLDSQLQVWNILSIINRQRNLMEDENSRTQRMKVKWQEWNNLAQRKLRLQSKIRKLEAK